MDLPEKIASRNEKISIIGLGYVGLPIAVAFARKAEVIGFDINAEKIELYKNGVDPTNEVGNEALKNTTVKFTSNPSRLEEAKFHIVAVPTPVNRDHTPDLGPLKTASQTLGRNLKKESIVVYESTVYPGVTEEICLPILEEESGLKCGIDFNVGYSPERINPGDREHRFEKIVKVVAGMNVETLDIIAKVYELVIEAGVYRAESIQVAEAAKVIENTQRDINIAFMNELSIIFNLMGIDSKAVLEAAGTKWNFLDFTPGLVGGHCIGVDPYYLTYRAEQLGYHCQMILAGRKINDEMGCYVAENLVKQLIHAGVSIKEAKVAILGFTFKENCPDTRNTRVIDIINELKEYNIKPVVVDPVADAEEAKREYGLQLNTMADLKDLDLLVVAVAHSPFKEFSFDDLGSFYKKVASGKRVLLDLKGLYNKKEYESAGYIYWRL
jgi:UDP-N-acetyl-D-glucosamine/UDP-N-acetyl-D-galactosamine dehydrogenase